MLGIENGQDRTAGSSIERADSVRSGGLHIVQQPDSGFAADFRFTHINDLIR
jgi:hypothetical protein